MARKSKKEMEDVVKEMEEVSTTPLEKIDEFKPRFDKVVSTGSTLLDLELSGHKVHGGGLPGGVMVELYGPESVGKTVLLSEIIASTLIRGGNYRILDPEGRIDTEYTRIYGIELDKSNYYMPRRIKEMFNLVDNWKNIDTSFINVAGNDSLAALISELEYEEKDLRGQSRPKEFSEQLRKIIIPIRQRNLLFVCTNQIREKDMGRYDSSGGHAIPHYSSYRIKMMHMDTLEDTVTLDNGKTITRPKGTVTRCTITKSSSSASGRKTDIYIVENMGIDDVRANLQYLKDMNKDSTYKFLDQSFKGLESAIKYIYNNKLQKELREEVITLWNKIDELFNNKRLTRERI